MRSRYGGPPFLDTPRRRRLSSAARTRIMNRSLVPGTLVALLVAVAAGGGWALHGVFPPAAERPGASPRPAPGANPVEGLQAGFAGVAEHVRPAVVNLGTIQKARSHRAPGPQSGRDDPFFQDFFNQFFGPEGPGGS